MAPVTSSAINKSKTVAPKAIARRRPAPPATKPQPHPTPAPNQHEPEQDATEGASRSDKQPTPTLPTIQQPGAARPTPPATQQPVVAQPTPPATQRPASSHPTPATQRPAVVLPTPPAPQEPEIAQPAHHEPASQADTQVTNAQAATRSTPSQITPSAQPQDATPSQHPSPSTRRITPPPPVAGAKRKRNGPPTPQQPSAGTPHVQDTPMPDAQSVTEQPSVDAPSTQDTPVPEPQHGRLDDAPVQQSIEVHSTGAAPMAPMAMMVSPERARKMAQQTTVRPAKAAPKPPKPPTRAKRQKKTPATDNTEGDAEGNVANSVDGNTAQTGEGQVDEVAAPTQRKKQRARKQPKSASRVIEDEDGNVIDEPQSAVEDEQPATKQRKPRQPRKPREPRKKKDPNETAAEDAEIEDPELHEVDPDAVTMFDLTRDRGLGKQSERETKMAGIDWDEVARKRLEAAEAIRAGKSLGLNGEVQNNGDDNQEEGADNSSRPRPSRSGPKLRVDADGNMVVEEDSLRIDRLAQAEANAANLEITEEDDLTKRVNQMSWLSAKRKDPTERLPFFKMKSDPWGEEETDRFYEALKMFGTDFFIISKMFPPKTRRQIKLKFIREERLDADRINRALSGESTVPMSLDHFAEATGQDIENFKDPRELEEELRAEGEEQREEIAKKKKEMEESKHQRDIQMAAREKEQAERAEQRKLKARQRMGRRGGLTGSGAL